MLANFRSWLRTLILSAALTLTLVTQSQELPDPAIERPELVLPPASQAVFDRNQSGYQVVERGPHHRVVERLVSETNARGESVERVARYTALGIGMNRYDKAQEEWIPAEAIIEPFRGGAAAQKGQQKVFFTRDISEEGSVEIVNADSITLKATVLGLAYFDTVTGNDAIIATVQSSVGTIIPPNQIIYRDAFDNIEADVLYTYRLSGVEQEVILRAQPPLPQEYGLPNETTRLEVLTEFFDTPEPEKNRRVIIERVSDPGERVGVVEPDLADEELRFGVMLMPSGRAFSAGSRNAEENNPEQEIPVGKKWQEIEGRTILFESVEHPMAAPELEKLPRSIKARASLDSQPPRNELLASATRTVPSIVFSGNSSGSEPLEIAFLDSDDADGYVIDYTTLSGTLTNYTFEAGETYFIDYGNVFTVSSWTKFNSGCVIKFGPYSTLRMINLVSSYTEAGNPVIVTVKDDDSVGEIISGSTGGPAAYCGYPAFMTESLSIGTSYRTFNHFDFRHVHGAIYGHYNYGPVLRNSRFFNVSNVLYGVFGGGISAHNILIDDCGTVFTGSAGHYGANCTIHDAVSVGSGSLTLVNSLLVDVDTIYSYTNQGAAHNVELSSATGVFKAVGGGQFYLPDESPYRDLGTSSISTTLADELTTLTTVAPESYDGVTIDSDRT